MNKIINLKQIELYEENKRKDREEIAELERAEQRLDEMISKYFSGLKKIERLPDKPGGDFKWYGHFIDTYTSFWSLSLEASRATFWGNMDSLEELLEKNCKKEGNGAFLNYAEYRMAVLKYALYHTRKSLEFRWLLAPES